MSKLIAAADDVKYTISLLQSSGYEITEILQMALGHNHDNPHVTETLFTYSAENILEFLQMIIDQFGDTE